MHPILKEPIAKVTVAKHPTANGPTAKDSLVRKTLHTRLQVLKMARSGCGDMFKRQWPLTDDEMSRPFPSTKKETRFLDCIYSLLGSHGT